MTAKTMLKKRLISALPGVSEQDIDAALEGFTITREAETERMDLPKKIKLYLGAKRIDGLSPRTLKNYGYVLNMFSERIQKPTAKITTDDIRDYISYLGEERKLKNTSLQTHINTLRAFFGWLLVEEKIKKNPMLKIHSLKLDKKRARSALSAEELERFRDACKTYREKALVEFLVSTGSRLSEVVELRYDDLNFAERSVVVHGKGDKERVVYFSVRARLMLEEYKRERKGGEGLFVSVKSPYRPLKQRAIERIIQSLSERAQMPKRVHPHLLRHTFATQAINSGMDVTVIQQLLGHEDVATTQIYAEMNKEVVRNQYNRFVAS